MDLPNMIVDAATVKYVEGQKEKSCEFVISFHERYIYRILFTSAKHEIYIAYKDRKSVV